MKIELNKNKVLFNNGSTIQEIHPFWLRERVEGEEFLDKRTQQRLFDPSSMNTEIIIKEVTLLNNITPKNLVDSIANELNWGAEKLRDDITCLALDLKNTELVKKIKKKKEENKTDG